MKFKDHFSKQSQGYTRYRPVYPSTLYSWLASLVPSRKRVWDCATGNGQAAVALADHFLEVVATDASENQITHCKVNPRVCYYAAPAEASGLESASMDMITVAQAIHWFNFHDFFTESRRVLKPEGVLAIWGYGILKISPEIDAVINQLYGPMLEPFWPPERKYIEDGYATIPFPFHQIESPQFSMETQWSLSDLTGYLRTWSAVIRYAEHHGTDPVGSIDEPLKEAWGKHLERRVDWPIYLKVGRNI